MIRDSEVIGGQDMSTSARRDCVGAIPWRASGAAGSADCPDGQAAAAAGLPVFEVVVSS
jgi:hypothetical protein